jgi:methylmalonyl-CoA mutase
VLETPTHDGLTLSPLYTAADAPPPGDEGLPGLAPFTRGALPRHPAGRWDARQVVTVRGDGAAGAGRARHELENGAASVLLDLRHATAIDADLLDAALEGVYLDAAAVGLDAGPRSPEAAAALRAVWARRGVPDAEARGSLGLDPIGEHASAGGAHGPVEDRLAEAAALAAEVAARHAMVRTVMVDAARYHGAGASDAQQLACAVATGIEYLRALTGAGMDIGDALGQVEFRLAAGPQQFPTIAAFRAARRLWARVAEVCGAPPPARAARLHAISARAMATRYDPWVNLLRGTVACLAAGIGGAEVVTVEPYDVALGADSDLGRRLARNTQSLLIDEANLGRVADPAGGSWFVESLTERLAADAWDRVQSIEAAGGMLAALAAGEVQWAVAATWEARRDAIAHRREAITGVSEFPDIDEAPPPDEPPGAPEPTPIPALVPHRYAEPFERQRARADRHAATTGERPAVFLAALGPPAAHTARATFAANLFAAAGIRAVGGGEGLGPGDDAGEAFAASGARLACICSSDEVYAERAAAAAAQLSEAGAARLYLAGRPGDRGAELAAAGVHEYAYAGCDALALLAGALDAAGVAP